MAGLVETVAQLAVKRVQFPAQGRRLFGQLPHPRLLCLIDGIDRHEEIAKLSCHRHPFRTRARMPSAKRIAAATSR